VGHTISGEGGVFMTVNLYAPPPDVMVVSHDREPAEPSFRDVIRDLISRIMDMDFREGPSCTVE
jgi:hypothetical protein